MNRWGFLRKKAPKNYSIKKTISTVSCLCSLYNFLIDQRCAVPDANTPSDALTLAFEGAVPMERAANGDRVPGQLLQAGDHCDDDSNYTVRRSIYQTHQGRSLPRTAFHWVGPPHSCLAVLLTLIFVHEVVYIPVKNKNISTE